MKERGILFSAPMVRALLAGTKTQTRRIVKPQPVFEILDVGLYNPTRVDRHGDEYPGPEIFGAWTEEEGFPCPYGQPGDLLWVRETWQAIHVTIDPETGYGDDVRHAETIPADSQNGYWVPAYAADPGHESHRDDRGFPWRPAIHMPRWASRITLRITDVRVERLQSISQADAIAEGIAAQTGPWLHHVIADYRRLWTSINGADSWDSNPWVWVVSFERIADTSTASHE